MEQQPTETAPNTRPPQSPANSCCGSDSAPDCEKHPEEWDRYQQERREKLPPVEYAQEVVGVMQEHVDTLKYFERKNEERRSQQNASKGSRSPGTSKAAPKLETSRSSSGSGSGSGKKRKQSLFKIPKEPETALETSRYTEGTDPELEDHTPAFVPAPVPRIQKATQKVVKTTPPPTNTSPVAQRTTAKSPRQGQSRHSPTSSTKSKRSRGSHAEKERKGQEYPQEPLNTSKNSQASKRSAASVTSGRRAASRTKSPIVTDETEQTRHQDSESSQEDYFSPRGSGRNSRSLARSLGERCVQEKRRNSEAGSANTSWATPLHSTRRSTQESPTQSTPHYSDRARARDKSPMRRCFDDEAIQYVTMMTGIPTLVNMRQTSEAERHLGSSCTVLPGERGFREWDPEDEGYDHLVILPHLPAEQKREHQTAERLRGQAALTWSEQMGWGRCPGRMNLRFSGPERERGYHTLDQIEQILPGEPGYTEWSEWPEKIQDDPLELHEFLQPPEEEEDSDEGLEADDGSPVQPSQGVQQIRQYFEESETKKQKEEERVLRAIEADRQARQEGQSTSRDPPGRFWKPTKSAKRTFAERDSEGNSSSKLRLKQPNTAPPPSLVNRPLPYKTSRCSYLQSAPHRRMNHCHLSGRRTR